MHEQLVQSDIGSQIINRFAYAAELSHQGLESAFEIYQSREVLQITRIIIGNEDSVKLTLPSRDLNVVNSLLAFHTHPSGLAAPSPQDSLAFLSPDPFKKPKFRIFAIGALMEPQNSLSVLFTKSREDKNFISRTIDYFMINMETYSNFDTFGVSDESARVAWHRRGYQTYRVILLESELASRKFSEVNLNKIARIMCWNSEEGFLAIDKK